MSAKERGRVMYRLADLIERDREELAQLETLVRALHNM
jgi:acyl-CoA reductase-like NAD-dependent aldehyde dehydrogenase